MQELSINTILLIVLNVIGGLVWFQISDLKRFLLETRRKLDAHVENVGIHYHSHNHAPTN